MPNNFTRSNGVHSTSTQFSSNAPRSFTISGSNMGPGSGAAASNESGEPIFALEVSNSFAQPDVLPLVGSNPNAAAAQSNASGDFQETGIQPASSQGAASSHSLRVETFLEQQPVAPAHSGVIPVVEEAKLAKVEELNLSGWRLQSIPDPIGDSAFTNLNLSKNRINASDVNSFFTKQLPKLAVLDLSHNNLSDSDLKLDGQSFPNVHTIILNNCSISNINLSNFNKLKYLDVSSNKNITITFDDSARKSLKVLNLNGCELGDAAINVLFSSTFESLNHLYLGGNKLTTAVFLNQCSFLTDLELTGNLYESFEINDQNKLVHLKHLWLRHNQLKTIKLTDLSKLIGLDLSHNQLRMSVNQKTNKERFDLTGAPTLKTLILSNNPLTFVDDLFLEVHFQNLAQLCMSDCNLVSFRLSSNQQLSSLTHLDLSANGIQYIDCQKFPAQFFDIKMTLDISGNTGFGFINTNDYYTKSISVINFQDSLPLHQVNQRLHIANTNIGNRFKNEVKQLQFKVLKNAKPLILSMSKGDQDFVEKLRRFYNELDTQLSKLPGQLKEKPPQALLFSGGCPTIGNAIGKLSRPHSPTH